MKEYNRNFTRKLEYVFIDIKKGIIKESVANNSKFIKFSNWKPKKSNIKLLVNNFFK